MNSATIQQSFLEKQCFRASERLIQKIIEVKHYNNINHFDDIINDSEIRKHLFSLTEWIEMLTREGV